MNDNQPVTPLGRLLTAIMWLVVVVTVMIPCVAIWKMILIADTVKDIGEHAKQETNKAIDEFKQKLNEQLEEVKAIRAREKAEALTNKVGGILDKVSEKIGGSE